MKAIIFYAIQIYTFAVLIWAILSWFNKGKGLVNDIYQALDKIVDPYVGLFRKFIPNFGGLDFSPFIAIIVLQFVGRIVTYALPF